MTSQLHLLVNVAVHSRLLELAFESFEPLAALVKDKAASGDELRVCALGGGPGSELLGLVRFTQSLGLSEPVYLEFVLVERVREWDESWYALKKGLDAQIRAAYGANRSTWPVSLSHSFLPLDLTNASELDNFPTRFAETDLVIVS